MAAGCVAGIGVAGLGWGVFEAHNVFRLRRVSAAVLPSEAAPIRVLHFSDVHLMPYQKAKRRWLRRLATLKPDLVISTGDNVCADEVQDVFVDCLGPLLDGPGVFVFGSNDYRGPVFKNPMAYFGGPSQGTRGGDLDHVNLAEKLTRRGWLNTMGQRHLLTINGTVIEFRGTHDFHKRMIDYPLVAGPASPEAELSIGVTHAPYHAVLAPMTADGIELIFAGHTHGGQVCVPGYGALVTNCDLAPRAAKGLSEVEADRRRALLHVSGGIGTSPFTPFRFACPPEATLLTLVSRDVGGGKKPE